MCLNRDQLEHRFEESMNISLYNKIKFGCNCYEEEIKKIKKQIKKDNHRLFLTYILCTVRFNQLYKTIIEKRFAPGGKGYLEAQLNFDMLKLNM